MEVNLEILPGTVAPTPVDTYKRKLGAQLGRERSIIGHIEYYFILSMNIHPPNKKKPAGGRPAGSFD
jgi:hypothetical protein